MSPRSQRRTPGLPLARNTRSKPSSSPICMSMTVSCTMSDTPCGGGNDRGGWKETAPEAGGERDGAGSGGDTEAGGLFYCDDSRRRGRDRGRRGHSRRKGRRPGTMASVAAGRTGGPIKTSPPRRTGAAGAEVEGSAAVVLSSPSSSTQAGEGSCPRRGARPRNRDKWRGKQTARKSHRRLIVIVVVVAALMRVSVDAGGGTECRG